MQHSSIVGGSTAKRVIKCPASVRLTATLPPAPASRDADRGTLLHNVIALHLETGEPLERFLGHTYGSEVLTQALIEDKLRPALDALEEIDPDKRMEFAVETRVGFGAFLPGVFGSTDYLGRIGNRAIVLDWKFGDGVAVAAQENEQLLFYAAAAMRTDAVAWVFEGVNEIECIIVQPPVVRRWTTTRERVGQFETALWMAVQEAKRDNATLAAGDHCRWCRAKPTCPLVSGEAARALRQAVRALNPLDVADWLSRADLLEQWIAELREVAQQMVEDGATLPGFKLVAKRAKRTWTDDVQAAEALRSLGIPEVDLMETSLRSPAALDKVLKKRKLTFPEGITQAVSSGNTLAREDDPRPPVLTIGRSLSALSKL